MKLLSRSQAIALGEKRYFTGKPCRHGHVVERYMSTGACCACQKKRDSSPKTRAAKKKYRATPEAKTAKKKYNESLKGKTTKKKYNASPKIKTAKKKYSASHEGRAVNKKYKASPEARAANKKYNATPKRKADTKKYNAKCRLNITDATPTTMEQAKILGEKFYFTGEPCEYDHFNFRDVSSGECCKCNVYFLKEVKKGVELYDEMF